jgi:hypothetical protein
MGRISRVLFAAPLLVCSIGALGQGPNVFIDGNGSEQEAARMTKTVRRDDQTMELARDLLKACHDISITREETSSPDYFLLLNRGRESALNLAASQVMLLDGQKNVIYSSKEGTVAHAARDGCKAILADWKKRRAAVSPKSEPPKNWWQTSAPQEKKQ